MVHQIVRNSLVGSAVYSLFLSVKKVKGNLLLIAASYQQDPENPSTCVKNFEMMVPKGDHYPTYNNNIGYVFNIRDSICGLVCCENVDSTIIWNPTLRQNVTLPQPYKITKPLTSLLGYDPIAGGHKVLCTSVSLSSEFKEEWGRPSDLHTESSWVMEKNQNQPYSSLDENEKLEMHQRSSLLLRD